MCEYDSIDSDIVISEDVFQVFESLYVSSPQPVDDYEKKILRGILATPPLVSVVRVNLNHTEINDAIGLMTEYLRSLHQGENYVVTKHNELDDVLVVTSKQVLGRYKIHAKEVIVDAICGAAILRGADLFAPGVLAADPSMKIGCPVSIFVDVDKKCRKGLMQRFAGSRFFAGSGVSRVERKSLFEKNVSQNGIAIHITEPKYNLPSFDALDSKTFFPQNFPSILVGHTLKPPSNSIVLDMCSSPGGKALHVATILRNTGVVICIDKTENKVARIRENASLQALSNIHAFVYDSTKLCKEGEWSEMKVEHRQPPYPTCSFKYIILDPPCSGLGQRPTLRCTMRKKDLESYPIYQRKLFKQAVSLLQKGGTLVYSTCTLQPAENEQQVSWALKTFQELELLTQPHPYGRHGLLGYGLNKEECQKVQRFDSIYSNVSSRDKRDEPSHQSQHTKQNVSDLCQSDTIGFFIAYFRKN